MTDPYDWSLKFQLLGVRQQEIPFKIYIFILKYKYISLYIIIFFFQTALKKRREEKEVKRKRKRLWNIAICYYWWYLNKDYTG